MWDVFQMKDVAATLVNTHREGLRPLLDHEALYQVCEDLRLDHRLRDGGSVLVPEAHPGQGWGQGQGRRRREGSSYGMSYRMNGGGGEIVTQHRAQIGGALDSVTSRGGRT